MTNKMKMDSLNKTTPKFKDSEIVKHILTSQTGVIEFITKHPDDENKFRYYVRWDNGNIVAHESCDLEFFSPSRPVLYKEK